MRTPLGIAALVGLSFAAWAQARPADPPAARAPKPSLVRISGVAQGLYPGARRRVPVTFVNGSRMRLRVRWTAIAARSPGRGCQAADLAVGRLRAPRRLAPRARARGWLHVRLLPSAPDACQGAHFPLRVRAGLSGP